MSINVNKILNVDSVTLLNVEFVTLLNIDFYGTGHNIR